MEDLSGMGKSVHMGGESTQTCSMSANTTDSGWTCHITDCPHYGKWYCPFSGW
jgi:hypothetical protein